MKKEANVNFKVYDSKDHLVFDGFTNEDGILEVYLPYGKYIFKQMSSTDGYEKVNDFEIVVNDNNTINRNLYDLIIETPNASISIMDFFSMFKSIVYRWLEYVY